MNGDNRLYWIDNFKGFLIILVVFAHMLVPYIGKYFFIDSFYKAIYSFHMPAFVLVSGMLVKQADQDAKKTSGLFVEFLINNILYLSNLSSKTIDFTAY